MIVDVRVLWDLASSWREQADKYEVNALEADSIGDMTATVQDLETKCAAYRRLAGELEKTLRSVRGDQ